MKNTTMMNLPGYDLKENLYQGTRTLVYRGTGSRDGRAVIIKVLRNPHPNFNELVQFRNQYAIARHLEHPGFVRPLALERYGNGYALVMPDDGAIALSDYWKQSERSLTEFLAIAIQLSEALHYLIQQRIIHKDIKPTNILIHPETRLVKLIDFSISSLLAFEQQQLANPNLLEGTLAYISPEQTGRMNRGIDYRTDFYSLGATMFELLTGKLPFETREPMELVHCHIARAVQFANDSEIPVVLQAIVRKLMAKNAEDRYQSAMGLKHDLELCLQQLGATGEIVPFEIGERDRSDRFFIPEKLYGRDTQVQTLLEAFLRVADGATEMMLVAGFSGIGKTAVINEVHKPIVEKRGYFIKGKFDQFNRNIPFSAFVQAFRDLMGQLLSESDGDLANWKAKIAEAVGDNGQILIDVIPELEQIVGKQPPVTELSGSAAQNRFNLLFQKFIALFATPEHPLAIFLDDLQWADSGSLDLMKVLMGNSDTGHLLLLAAYRDNEVFPTHPLMLTLDEIGKPEAIPHTLTLEPLDEADITRLVADTLLCSTEIAAPLSQLVYQKTRGNPFFTTQFLKGLYEDGCITFQGDDLYWQCDLTQVRQLTLTDDVVAFMVGRLRKLPEATQSALKLAACIGNRFDLGTLVVACDRDRDEVAADLWMGLQEGFVIPESETYKFFVADRSDDRLQVEASSIGYRFLHDRVQQAAYSLIQEEQKQLTHLQIGRLLLDRIGTVKNDKRIFDIVGQFNIGINSIDSLEERSQVAELNLIAGEKALAATASASAEKYCRVGIHLLQTDCWQTQYSLTLALYEARAEAAYLNGNFDRMEHCAETILKQAKSLLDTVKIHTVKIQAYMARNRTQEAIESGLNVLKKLNVHIPIQPKQFDVVINVLKTKWALRGRKPKALFNMPAMENKELLAAMQVLGTLATFIYLSHPFLSVVMTCKAIRLSVKHGNAPSSSVFYASYSITLGAVLGDLNTANQFGQLSLHVASQLNDKLTQARTLFVYSCLLVHWQQPPSAVLSSLKGAYLKSLEIGDFSSGVLIAATYGTVLLFWDSPLSDFNTELQGYIEAAEQMQEKKALINLKGVYQMVQNLLGNSSNPTVFKMHTYDETLVERSEPDSDDPGNLAGFYISRLYLSYFFEDPEAITWVERAKDYLEAYLGTFYWARFHTYASLAYLRLYPHVSKNKQRKILQKVKAYQKKVKKWATYAPVNFLHAFELVEAEIHQVLGHRTEAIDLYDRAIAGAKENGYLPEEAIANELAAKFYLHWGKEKIAATYMLQAYYCYARWGAKAKIDQLEAKYPLLLTPILQKQRVEFNPLDSLNRIATTLTSTLQDPTQTGTQISEALDFASILQAAQTLSSTIELDQLLANIVQIILTNAGAQKTVLLVPHDNEQWQLRAMAQLALDGAVVTSTISLPLTADSPVPVRLVQYVKNTTEPVKIDDAKTDMAGILEGYLLKNQPQSVFCVPLLDRGNLVAILYLEHPTTKGVFTRNRQTIIEFLCAQAAIALQNSQLYEQARVALRDLKQAQLQLVQSEKMSALGNLVAGVAHEINNPIGFLQGNIEPAGDYAQDLLGLIALYQAEYPEPQEVIEEEIEAIDLEFIREDFPKLLESMNLGVDRIRNISKSLRTFSRKDRERKTEFNIHEGIDSTLLILKHRTKAKQERPVVEIVKDYGDIPVVQCYPGQLNQVFMNILANAIDAFDQANEGKSYTEIEANPNRIAIRTSMVEERVEIQIADNGCGMKPETKDRIFEQGFTTKGVGKGTGLGMAIAYNIVTEKHGGTITCDSNIGVGTTFAIALPIA